MSDWKEYKLDELVEITSSKRIMRSEYQEDGIPFFRSKEIIELNSGNEITTELFISKERFLEIKNKFGTPSYGDILLTSVGTLGVPYFVNYKEEFYFKDGNLTWFRKFNNILRSKYLYYWFSSPVGRKALKEITIGSTQPALTITGLKSLTIHLPTLEEQDYIIEILDHLSSKIYLNTQINQTLEQIAQALFKSWFVDFDPVRAKVQALSDGLSLEQAELAAMQAISGKTPEELTALSQTQPDRYAELAETAKAFPCEMEEIDGVEVPKGWEVKPLPEIIDFLEGPGIRNWQYTDEEDGIKFINIRCIQNGDLTLTTANKIKKEEAFGKYKHFQLEEDDIVVSTSGTLGRFAFVRKEHLPLSLNTSVIRFRPIKNKSTLGFITGFVENQLQHELEIRASGSAQRNFGPTHLKQISLLVPDFKLLELHQKYVSSLFEKRKQLLSEIDLLKDTRDLLLPKLLNGEI
ncbi:MAG: restriction endonuclease subunit S [Haemophilus parainfluenzae]|uniref:restriction endonuclease subunit S n=3 Tax=Bacteria TaxID=2 RepID=UPI002804F595|nr:restriction endonuclease subunit S [uncultured Haemophilus sp.]MDU4565404.1 restriction endonuclease subunit S [Haemophilus parainfluenzae]MDU4638046.1 restriction endonuclease subunit S [Haemophilus parainfluenzae]MDU5990695.1 restriction endonuclease subunit S [Haemophilus parainfluenzae]MDU7969598.1 restriction endonuclease subunit S [Haemophilus parainfluenzae]